MTFCFPSITLPLYLHTYRNTLADLILTFSLFKVTGIRNKTTELYQNFFIIKIWHVSYLLTSNPNIVYIQHMCLGKEERKSGHFMANKLQNEADSLGNNRDTNRSLIVINMTVSKNSCC